MFDLAIEIGYAHPDHLFADLNGRQVLEWLARLEQQPIGEARRDVRQAIAIEYLLAPHMDNEREPLPDLMWPHRRQRGGWDHQATATALERLAEMYETPSN